MLQDYQIALIFIVLLESVALAYLADNYSAILLGCTVLITALTGAVALLVSNNRRLRIERTEHKRNIRELKQKQEKLYQLSVQYFSGSIEGPQFGMNEQELLNERRTNGINHSA